MAVESVLKGKRILALDDEEAISETIEDILAEVDLDTAKVCKSASKKIKQTRYGPAALDIMDVNRLTLPEVCVQRGIPAMCRPPMPSIPKR